MLSKNDILAVIPARGGSQGIKNKNLRRIGDTTLLAWTIKTALNSKVTKVVVSTDAPDIERAAKKYHEVDVVGQPSPMKDGIVNAVNVCLWYLNWMKAGGFEMPQLTLMLLPTSPFRRFHHINRAIEECDTSPSAIGITDACTEISLRRQNSDGTVTPLKGFNPNDQRQDCNPLFRVNGAIFCAQTDRLLEERTFHMTGAQSVYMDQLYSIDINTDSDLAFAEAIYKGCEELEP